ncbi:hypothetical protein XM38_046010 [Halomicronema hongdechloris C2206]|uniref:DUF58 domain-containing protein n=1 Tax=Halomicronema hongdechloris C2206 TaxID=1641165 RepID=A0A1Z3HTJ0_9CYAN|nr:DUF58 domain-containing protein [Halomicronema hongdechloris]ASC73630.1 hypothetical protein XM38_046010 [Halomicronema hongdechloris C2206]
MIPTTRLYRWLLIVGAIAPLVSGLIPSRQSLGLGFLMLLAVDSGLLVLMIVDGHRLRSQRLQVTRSPLSRLSIGRDNIITLEVQSGAWGGDMQIYDNYPATCGGTAMPLRVSLAPRQHQTLSFHVHPTQRGEFAWGDLQVRQRSPWGLAWVDWTITAATTVAVYPDLLGLRALSVRLALQSTGTLRQARRLGVGTEFTELRNYGIGDDPRLIDWKATARHHQPLVRVLEPEREQTLIVLLDQGRLMTSRVGGLSRFDWGLNATLALAMAGLHRGDRVGIGVFHRTLTTWLPPQGGSSRLTRFLEQLTPLQPVLQESDYLGAVTTVVQQQPRRALVVLLTDIVDSTASAELLSALMRLRPRYLPFCVTLRDPQVDRQAHTFTTEVIAAYGRAVALDLLAQRQAAFVQLRQRGTLVLDAPAPQISEALVDEYLRIKAKGRL